MVPHRGTNWAAPWLTSQIGQDVVLSGSYGRGCFLRFGMPHNPPFLRPTASTITNQMFSNIIRQYLKNAPKYQDTSYAYALWELNIT